MPQLRTAVWEGGNFGYKRDRKPFKYSAFIPDKIADWDGPLSGILAEAVAMSTDALGRLNTSSNQTNLEAVATAILRSEALGSSFIEGLKASNKKVAIAEYEPLAASVTARAVANNVKAMRTAIEMADKAKTFRVEHLTQIHRVLLAGTSEERFGGKIRVDQNWIGGHGSSPADADFIPPPPDNVRELLEDLVTFCNRADLPAVVVAALAHSQFETIHPFGDGNGRTGRCLIHVILRRRKLAPSIVPPISVVLASNASRYIRGLVDFREGDVADWIGLFCEAIRIAVDKAQLLGYQIDELLNHVTEGLGRIRRDSVLLKVIRDLPQHPIVSSDVVAKAYNVTPTAARVAINRLAETGTLSPVRIGRRRDREWVCEGLFRLLDQFETDISFSPVASKRQPAPSKKRKP